mmetsp:Transcript_25625/g.51336  ORF Transcript_25625/g.51336 Transcript_25625/m.51336 type:complete len:1008 (-) Transcript_25625:198-3221(-)
MKFSQAYFLLSVILAISAIVSSPFHYLLMAEVDVESEAKNPSPAKNPHDENEVLTIASDAVDSVMRTSIASSSGEFMKRPFAGFSSSSSQQQQQQQQPLQTAAMEGEATIDGGGNVVVSPSSQLLKAPKAPATTKSSSAFTTIEPLSSSSSSHSSSSSSTEKSYWLEEIAKSFWDAIWNNEEEEEGINFDSKDSRGGDGSRSGEIDHNSNDNHSGKESTLNVGLFSSFHRRQKEQQQQLQQQQQEQIMHQTMNQVGVPVLSPSKLLTEGEHDYESNENFHDSNRRRTNRAGASTASFFSRIIDPSLLGSITSVSSSSSPEKAEVPETSTSTTMQSSSSFSGNTQDENETSLTDLFDKILTSTPRLLAIANLLLVLTYLLHTAVADLFLGPVTVPTTSSSANVTPAPRGTSRGATTHIANPDNDLDQTNQNQIHQDQTRRQRRMGRERLAGYLLFKLLLVSSVIQPDTLDLLILSSWYTLLSFLRSLGSMAGSSINTAVQSGRSPQAGALRLLLVVLLCDFSAACVCLVLFRSAGWSMLVLLTCDCVLMGVDGTTHAARYAGAWLEEGYRVRLAGLEERQVELLHVVRRSERGVRSDGIGDDDESGSNHDDGGRNVGREPQASVGGSDEGPDRMNEEIQQLDREMEEFEATHSRRMAMLDSIVFALELFALVLTACHFGHIWVLHGASFGLVDAILALHINSTVSTIFKKVSERRNLRRISRDLDSKFEDASDLDIKKAKIAGDVCCICLASMTAQKDVKKLPCGHLYHAPCLGEVVERARSVELAKCPLCRSPLINGTHAPQRDGGGNSGNNNNNNTFGDPTNNNDIHNNNNNGGGGDAGEPQIQQARPNNLQQNNPEERALFRFSTEGILPAWLPIPAFSFEVVRRDNQAVAQNPENGGLQRFLRRGGEAEVVNTDTANNNNPEERNQERQPQPSFWRRLLILAGAVPMSPEEEAMAIEQLVDMFPQYDRSDLLRELRARGSAEAVVESVFLGLFSGIPRGGGAPS